MKVIVDDKIPYIKEVITRLASEVIFLPGKAFTPEIVKDADALIVRTRTICNRTLLEGSRVKFIATATIGYDHIDTNYCAEHGITWTNAPGCNADSVAQYMESTLLLLEKAGFVKSLADATIGIVGVGHVGSKVAQVAEKWGMKVLLNDPPRERMEKGTTQFVSLEEIKAKADVITFHTPLIRAGVDATYHIADAAFFNTLYHSPILINSSRGEVVDNSALLLALSQNKIKQAVIDVWENEPNINVSLLEKVFIGTPHIAGYAADGKANATRMALNAFCQFFNFEAHYEIKPPAPLKQELFADSLAEALLEIYNPLADSARLKSDDSLFEMLRGEYPLRREAKAYKINVKE